MMDSVATGLRVATRRHAIGMVLLIAGCSTVPPRDGALGSGSLVSETVLQGWHAEKARGGPALAGSDAWQRHVGFVERELRQRGVVGLERDPVRYARWYTSDDPAAGQWSLRVDGREIPVAGYWAYSGSTGAAGVTAPLVLFKQGTPIDLKGKIAVFEVPAFPDPPPAVFRSPPPEFATADLGESGVANEQWYEANYPTRFGRWDNALRGSGAAGAVVVFNLPAARVRGLYTFPLLSAEPVGVPGLYVDRDAGQSIRAAAEAGRSATLRLIASTEQAEPYFLSGILPGRNHGTPDDEFVLLVTHTDGPNLTQENGALAILAIVDYFARQPQSARRRSLLIVLDPQHYMPGRHLVDWYDRHRDLSNRIVASIGVEQLGQREYGGADFGLTGRPEKTLLFAQDNPRLVTMAIAAVQAEALPRTEIRVPARNQGMWVGLGDVAQKRAIPGFGTSTDMSIYWSTVPGIESFDARLARRQIGVLTRLTGELMSAELTELAVAVGARSR